MTGTTRTTGATMKTATTEITENDRGNPDKRANQDNDFPSWPIFGMTGMIRINGTTRITTVKPLLSGHRIKQTPYIKRTVAKVPKVISLIYFK